MLLAEFRGEMRTDLAELRGDVRVVHEQTSALATTIDRLEDRVDQMHNAQKGFVTKKEVDRKLRNGTAIIGTLLAALTLLINTLLAVATN